MAGQHLPRAGACDVPSHPTSFSFAPNPDWSRTYSKQPEIWRYLQRCSEQFGIEPHSASGTRYGARRGTTSESAGTSTPPAPDSRPRSSSPAWARSRAEEALAPGSRVLRGHRVPLGHVEPRPRPDGPARGIDRDGRIGHPVRPAIPQPDVEQTSLSSAPRRWIPPHTDRPAPSQKRLDRAVPALQKLTRGGIYTARETLILGFVKRPRLMKLVERLARLHIRRNIPDPEMPSGSPPSTPSAASASCPPSAGIRRWCSRTSSSSPRAWRRCARAPVVTRTASSTRSTPSSSAPASESGPPATDRLRGRDGRTMVEECEGSPRATSGPPSPVVPNLFMRLGRTPGSGTPPWST